MCIFQNSVGQPPVADGWGHHVPILCSTRDCTNAAELALSGRTSAKTSASGALASGVAAATGGVAEAPHEVGVALAKQLLLLQQGGRGHMRGTSVGGLMEGNANTAYGTHRES